MRGLSLFSGIGGLDLAFEWAGGTVVAMCEIEPYCRKVLRRHWPDVPLFEDVRRLRAEDVGTVDVVYGGFPCQPFSVAGDQKGRDDDRYLWPEFSRLVGELKPCWVVGENVPGILHLAADDVCADLERQGYEVGIWDFEAAAVGAPHRRERFFFVAHAGRGLCTRGAVPGALRGEREAGAASNIERPGGAPIPHAHSPRQLQQKGCIKKLRGRFRNGGEKVIANADSAGRKEQRSTFPASPKFSSSECGCGWEPEPGVGRVAHGVPHRVDRLRALGNAVVPQQAYPIFRAIIKGEAGDE